MISKTKFPLILVLAILFIAASIYFSSDNKTEFDNSQNTETANQTELKQDNLYKIIRVIDGDTIIVEINSRKEKIRLLGINTPESVDPRRPVECFGIEASDKAKEILAGGNVRLETDSTASEKDKYGRLLRYVFLEDGTNFNRMMISEGYAYEYTYDLPYKYQSEFKQAEKEARENKKGLWADGVCEKK